MTSDRRVSIAAGLLFVIATGAALVAAAIEPSRAATLDLAQVAANHDRYGIVALFLLVAAGTSVGIAVALYPVLRPVNGAVALGSVVFRTIEAVFYTVAIVALLSILRLATAPVGDQATSDALAGALVSLREHASLAGVFAFCTGALLYYGLFFKARLLPRWLSGWGILAELLMLTACVLAVFQDAGITGYTPLIVPIALQEMVLAAWLLAKGFSHPVSARIEREVPGVALVSGR
jgi:hypothetical protein